MRYSGAQRKRYLRILGAGWEDLMADFANLPSPEGNFSDLPIYAFIGDIVAVDGNGGTAYRTRLSKRYEASPYFRQMPHRLSLF
jgi:hypothetical protein